jgi:hypothetical protein
MCRPRPALRDSAVAVYITRAFTLPLQPTLAWPIILSGFSAIASAKAEAKNLALL